MLSPDHTGRSPLPGGLWRTPWGARPAPPNGWPSSSGPLLAQDVQLGGDGVEGGQLGGRRLQLEEGLGRAGLGVDEDAGDEVGEDPHAVHGADLEAGRVGERGELFGGEAAGHGVAGAPAARRVGKSVPRLGEVSGEGAGEDRAAQSGGEQTEAAAGPERGDGVPYAFGLVVDVLQDPVAEHGVVARAADHVEQSADVALDAGDEVGDPGLGGPALQREQRVGAGVDDRDPVAEAGDGDREVPGAAARVEDVEAVLPGGLDPAVEGVLEDVPDDGGTQGGARRARRRLSTEDRGRRWAVARLPERLRKLLPSARRAPESAPPVTQRPRQGHNLFEAAAEYVAACAEDDPARAEEAASRVSPGMLSFGVNELACRALLTLARERDESPRAVARSLLGLREVPARAPSDDA